MSEERDPLSTFRTASGLEVRVRPVRPTDAPELARFFEGLGARSRFQRFNRPLEDADPESVRRETERLAALPPEEAAAWLAVADLPGEPDAPVAVARYHRIPPDGAEAAIAVRDELQGQGLGRQLMLFLAARAEEAGIEMVRAIIRRDNAAMLAVLEASPYPLKRVEQGEYLYVEADLSRRR